MNSATITHIVRHDSFQSQLSNIVFSEFQNTHIKSLLIYGNFPSKYPVISPILNIWSQHTIFNNDKPIDWLNLVKTWNLYFQIFQKFLAKLKMFSGGSHLLPYFVLNCIQNLSRKIPMEKKSLTSKVSRGEQGYLLPFLSKKCIFRAEYGIFWYSSSYSKIIIDPNTIFYGSKIFFCCLIKI